MSDKKFRYSGRMFCDECDKRLPPRVVKFCSSECKVANRNARRRQKYAEQHNA